MTGFLFHLIEYYKKWEGNNMKLKAKTMTNKLHLIEYENDECKLCYGYSVVHQVRIDGTLGEAKNALNVKERKSH